MKPIVDRGHVPVISAMGNMPILKDIVVDMKPFWTKVENMKPWVETGYQDVPERGSGLAGGDRPDPEGGALHHVRLLRLRVQLDGGRPRSSSGRPRLRRASGSSATLATPRPSSASGSTTTSTGSGTAPAAISATSAARRASPRAMRSPSSGLSRSGSGSTVTWARSTPCGSCTQRDDRLAPRDGARSQDPGHPRRAQGDEVRRQSLQALEGAAGPHVADAVQEARALHEVVAAQGRGGAAGIVQAERALARVEEVHEEEEAE